jgi:hypothetical protein
LILLDSKALWRLHQYWDCRRAGAPFLAKRAIDPSDLRDILPHLFMIDADGAPPRFRVRLVGTAVARLVGRDSTGRYVDEVVKGPKQCSATTPYLAVISEGRPIAKRGPLISVASRSFIETEVLLLPASRSGAAADMIFGGTVEIGRQARLQAIEADRSVEYGRMAWGPDFAFAPTAISSRAAVLA